MGVLPTGASFFFGAPFLIHGIAHAVIPEAVAGAAVLLIGGFLTFRILRAGMGVTRTHLLIRTVLDPIKAVPWKDVTGFGVAGSKRARAFSALGQGEQRWSTVGCSTDSWNRQEDALAEWRLARALEDERLNVTPGATSEVPASPPPLPVLASWRDRWGRRLLTNSTLVVFLGVAGFLAWGGATSVGRAFAAADGAGTPGYFLAKSESCDKSNCTWSGDFLLPGGRVARATVALADAPGGLQVGARVAAVDVGDDSTFSGGSGIIYPAHDPGAWSTAVTELVLGGGLAVILLSLLLGQLRHPRLPARRPAASNRVG